MSPLGKLVFSAFFIFIALILLIIFPHALIPLLIGLGLLLRDIWEKNGF